MSGGRYLHVRHPLLEQLTPGTRVALGTDDEPIGEVIEPTGDDLLDGAEELGGDVEHCVLVEWPGETRWEYPEDLSIIRPTEEG